MKKFSRCGHTPPRAVIHGGCLNQISGGRCICHFSVAVIQHHDQKQLKGGFVLAYGSRGINSIMLRRTWPSGRRRKLADHISFPYTQEGERGAGKAKAISSGILPFSKDSPPKGYITSLNTTKIGERVRIRKPMGDITYSNHHSC